MFSGKTHYKWPFSIAMLNYQRVCMDHMLCNVQLDVTLVHLLEDLFHLDVVKRLSGVVPSLAMWNPQATKPFVNILEGNMSKTVHWKRGPLVLINHGLQHWDYLQSMRAIVKLFKNGTRRTVVVNHPDLWFYSVKQNSENILYLCR